MAVAAKKSRPIWPNNRKWHTNCTLRPTSYPSSSDAETGGRTQATRTPAPSAPTRFWGFFGYPILGPGIQGTQQSERKRDFSHLVAELLGLQVRSVRKRNMEEKTTGTAQLGDLSQMTDEQLLLEYRATGAEDLFAQLVSRYERELFNYLQRYLGDAALADDVFQATFLQVHLKHEQFDGDRKFRPWLYTIATNQAIDAQRRNRRHRSVSLDQNVRGEAADDVGTLLDLMENSEPGPVAELIAEERRAWVNAQVDNLPDSLRTSVNLVYYQGLKYREAADVLSIPVGTVKSRLHAAILKLNEAWTHSHPWKTDQSNA